MRRRSHKSIYFAVSIVLLMFSFSFAMAPLYRVLCKRTGLNGSVNFVENVVPADIKTDMKKEVDTRSILVQFVATNNANLPWEFHPNKNCLDVRPQHMATVTFFAKNKSDHVMTVQAVPSFTPSNAAQYFHKVECFCFTQQTLQPGEEKNMPVVFNLDADMPADIHTITLSYTLFNVPLAKTAAVTKDTKDLKKIAASKKLAAAKKEKQKQLAKLKKKTNLNNLDDWD